MADRSQSSGELAPSPTLGVIGRSPLGFSGTFRTGRLEHFQKQVGPIESCEAAQYLAGHAVCHALMNGIGRVAFVSLSDPSELAAIEGAVARLLESGPVDLVVIPGLVEVEPARAVVRTFQQWVDRQTALAAEPASDLETGTAPIDLYADEIPLTLWLDAPRGASPEEVLAHRRAVGGDPRRVLVATPWVSTITPGRRAAESLPPSCLVGPLFLGTTLFLKGVHELPSPPEPTWQEKLRRTGCGLLVAEGWRRQVRLAFPPPLRLPFARDLLQPTTLETRIQRDLRVACEPALADYPLGPELYKTLVRQARGVLTAYRDRGEITRFGVRCDEETNLDMKDGAAMEIWVQVPRRVREVIFKVEMARE
ncbi:MAG: hypothetical protein JW797_02405 [Bradymonadales bacterium]|nr:hypothetical protein [Bradymonadales bacterium]